MAEKNEYHALFHHHFSGLDRPAVFSALHRDPAVENDSCRVLFFLSASADRDLLMAENGIPHLLGDFRYFGCLLLHFDPVIVSDRFRLEHRRYRPIFPKKRIQRTAAGMRTTGGLARLRLLSPVRLRSDHPRRGLLNVPFFAPAGSISSNKGHF